MIGSLYVGMASKCNQGGTRVAKLAPVSFLVRELRLALV